MKNHAGAYQNINTQTAIIDADPHRLIQMLFDGAIKQIAIAKGCIERDDIAGRGESIGKAIAIVGGLRDTLNTDVNETDLPGNLASLYEYVTEALTTANLEKNIEYLESAHVVLSELREGWSMIRTEALEVQQSIESSTV